MQKGQALIFLLVGILVIVVAGGAFYLGRQTTPKSSPVSVVTSQTPQPTTNTNPESTSSAETSDWKIYTNNEFNYTMKYPNDLEITQSELRSSTSQKTPYSVLFNVKKTEPGCCGFPVLYVSVIPDGFTYEDKTKYGLYNFQPQQTIDEFFNMSVGDVKQTQEVYWRYKKLPDTTLAGLKGVTIENSNVWEGGNGLIDKRVYIRKSGYTYVLGTYYQTPKELNNFQTFLSLFKFN